jgi:hypothetical protein
MGMRSDLDALFKLPLSEFTSARNALVARLKKAGQHAEAQRAKALSKPPVSAWVVNQLYWRDRDLFDRLFQVGERLRHAQAAQQTRDATRDLVNARRDVVTAMAERAAETLRDQGYSATPHIMRRVIRTLEALSAYGSLPVAPSAGRLIDDVEPPGFETLAALLARSPMQAKKAIRSAEPRDLPARRRKEQQQLVATAKEAVRKAERAYSVARERAEHAAAKLKTAATRAKETAGERAAIEQRLARAAREAEAAHAQVRAAETDAREATQAAESAERALELARRQLQQVAGAEDKSGCK